VVVAQRLSEEDVEELLPGSRHDVALLFIDIHGFTAMSERMRPEELGPFLGEFHKLVTRCVFACGGTIDKFIGDGALAVFGAMGPRADAAVCALGCAEDVLAGVEAWSFRRVAQGLTPVEVTIGAHHGEAFVGIVGSEGMLEFTVLGDTVNVGERLQRLATETRSDLVVSEAFRRVCGDAFPAAAYHSLGLRRLSGRSEEVEAWARRASPAMPAPAALEPPAPLSTRGSYVGHGPRPRRRQRSSPRPR
jgi:adenylate cyclase